MAWDRSAPTHPKYQTREHRAARARLEREMQARGYLICAQPICLMPTRMIRQGEAWHVAHDDTGTTIIGPACARCNVVDGAKRGNARARKKQTQPSRWKL